MAVERYGFVPRTSNTGRQPVSGCARRLVVLVVGCLVGLEPGDDLGLAQQQLDDIRFLAFAHASSLTSWISHRRSPVSELVRACAVIWFRSGYSHTSGELSVETIRMRTGVAV